MIISKYWTPNYLYDLYKKRLVSYISDNQYLEWEMLDWLVILHYCLEFQINEFFRDWFLFCTPEKNAATQSFMHKRIDKLNFIDKVTFFLYTNEQTIDSDIDKKKLIDGLIKFCEFRNTIFHWSELSYSYEDSSNLNLIKWPNYTDLDFKKQITEYENLLGDLKEFAKHSSLFFNKWHDSRINNILKSVFSKE